jgi:hypothetical protein
LRKADVAMTSGQAQGADAKISISTPAVYDYTAGEVAVWRAALTA